MRIPKILNYILISLFLSVFSSAYAQEPTPQKEEVTNENGLSIGFDLAPLIIMGFDSDRKGIEFVTRYMFKKKWFVIGEVGFENVSFESDAYDYKSNGGFLRLGADYNFFKVDEPGNNDIITFGLRYGIGTQSHESPRYTILDDYWGDYTGKFGLSNVTSHWIEFVGGIRTEVLKNFYMGWTIRMKTLIAVGNTNKLKPYTIPGYGRGDNSVNMGFTYTLEYYFSFKKRK